MAGIDWRIQGFDLTTCSCDWGCPCQFMAPPTQGFCRAAVGFHIAKGHFGDIALDGLSFGGLFAWPKAIHEGNGEETEPGATIFNVFAPTYTKVHSPMFKPIIVEVDLAARTGRFVVEGVVEARIEPIRNPVTGKPSYARIVLPAGFEYEQAEVGSSTVRTSAAPIPLAWTGSHGHMARLDMTGKGVVRERAA